MTSNQIKEPYNQEKRFITYNKHLDIRLKLVEDAFEILEDHNNLFGDYLKLNYYFFSNTAGKIDRLGVELLKMGYSVEFETINEDDRLYVVTGHTNELKISPKSVIEWIMVMCDLGFRFDCRFDSWELHF